jgi:hypothetical protein
VNPDLDYILKLINLIEQPIASDDYIIAEIYKQTLQRQSQVWPSHGLHLAKQHTNSATRFQMRSLPTRVLDVGVQGEDIFLLDSRESVRGYTILKHCWAPLKPRQPPSRLCLYTNLEFPTRSSTFKVAVRITRILGIKYLWIDCLCIVQRCMQDWEKESGKMHEYYRNAYVTIAAIDSKDSFGGILLPREGRIATLSTGNTFVRHMRTVGAKASQDSALESRA